MSSVEISQKKKKTLLFGFTVSLEIGSFLILTRKNSCFDGTYDRLNNIVKVVFDRGEDSWENRQPGEELLEHSFKQEAWC